ncbi:MAG: hypothetical protein II972_03185 [Elusimicrobiaceae bacterium]|nr:hypothetical protein [Elusimicrobiaceae bacterium]
MNKYLFLLFLFCPLLLNAGVKGDLKLGNKAYKQEKYGSAYEYYQKAAKAGSLQGVYNSAAALYRLEDYGGASEQYLKAAQDSLEKEDKLAQDSYYNLASSQYKNQQTKEALLSARQAVLLNMKDEAAIHNMQFMLEEHSKNKQDQQNKQGNKNAPQDNQDKSQNQNQQGSNNQDKQNQDNQDQEQDKDKLSQEQAQDILKMLGEGEKKNTPPPLQAASGKEKDSQTQVENDW